MTRELLLICWLTMLAARTVDAQSITAEQAFHLRASVASAKNDEARINDLLALARYHIYKPGEHKADLDSGQALITEAGNLNKKIQSKAAEGNILFTTSVHVKESGNKEKARELVSKAVTILKDEKDKNLAGQAYMELSGHYDFADGKQLVERLELVRAAVACYKTAGNTKEKAASLQMLGDLYNLKGDQYLALQTLQASLDAYNEIKYPQVQGIYCLMGFVYSQQREYRRSMDMQLLALKTAESVGDSSMQLCQIYNYLGELQNGLFERKKAIYYYEKALGIAERHRDVFAIYLATLNIANTWSGLNEPNKALDILRNLAARHERPKSNHLEYNVARCYITSYTQLKQYAKARPYADQLIERVTSLDLNPRAKISYLTVAIRYFVTAGEYTLARKYLKQHGEVSKDLNDLYYLAATQRLWFMLDTARHDYKAATAHLLEASRLTDSLSKETKSRQIDELQIQFETEKKEITIANKEKDIQLLTEKSLLQQSRIEQSTMARNFVIAGAVLLLLILALVYNRYTIKKKSNLILKQQQEQINEQNLSLHAMVHKQERLLDEKGWLLKEIHHRVKNNLQIVMSLLNSQSAYIENGPALAAINNSQHRVHAMSLIHQKLYNTENVSSIDMSVYIPELSSYLADSFNARQRVRFVFSIEPLEMDVSHAVPLGLILNEAITNALKYAFPDNRDGVITIQLRRTAPYHYLLSIADDGIGIPPKTSEHKPASLGESLMKGLSEDLDGILTISNDNGTTIKLVFIYDMTVRGTGKFATSAVSTQ